MNARRPWQIHPVHRSSASKLLGAKQGGAQRPVPCQLPRQSMKRLQSWCFHGENAGHQLQRMPRGHSFRADQRLCTASMSQHHSSCCFATRNRSQDGKRNEALRQWSGRLPQFEDDEGHAVLPSSFELKPSRPRCLYPQTCQPILVKALMSLQWRIWKGPYF